MSGSPPAILVVGGGHALGRAVVARLAAVTRVVLGEVDPGGLGPALAEIERVRVLYGRADLPALVVGPDVPALVRCADGLLPPGYAVVAVEPTDDLDALLASTAPGTRIVVLRRSRPAQDAGPARPHRRLLAEGRTLWSVVADGPGETAAPGPRASTAAEVAAARTVRDLLFPAMRRMREGGRGKEDERRER